MKNENKKKEYEIEEPFENYKPDDKVKLTPKEAKKLKFFLKGYKEEKLSKRNSEKEKKVKPPTGNVEGNSSNLDKSNN